MSITTKPPLNNVGNEHDGHPFHQQRVLIADDDTYIREFLELILKGDGYDVISVSNGSELVRVAQQRIPRIILVDLMMPEMDGYEAIRQLRNDTRTAHIPLLILTARIHADDLVTGFETGADDYISKPFDTNELLARVKSHIRRAGRHPVLNSLSGLPGGTLTLHEIRHRLELKQTFALLYADLDNFKAFNDTYGFSHGDRAILMLADILQHVIASFGNQEDFIGHIGGDDFALITTPDRVETICEAIIKLFDREAAKLYTADDWQRGYLSGVDRYGFLRRFKLLSISIGVVLTQDRPSVSAEDLARIAAEMKHYAQAQPGSSYAIDQRVEQVNAPTERRGPRRQNILIASSDASLLTVLQTTFNKHGYTVYEATNVVELKQVLYRVGAGTLVLADAQLGDPLWKLCAEQSHTAAAPSIVILVHDEAELLKAKEIGGTNCLKQPLPLTDVVAYVDQLLHAAAWE